MDKKVKNALKIAGEVVVTPGISLFSEISFDILTPR